MDLFIILFSAGLGNRLNTTYPKPLSPIIKSTVIDYNLNYIIKILNNINIRNFSIYVNLHKRADQIYKYVLENYQWLVKREKLKFLFEHKPLGHIGTINKLKYNILRYNKLLLINCDSIIPSILKIISEIINTNLHYMILHQTNLSEQNPKTITHFYIKPQLNIKNLKIYKIQDLTQNIKNLPQINLYTGTSLININKQISNLLLSENFPNLNFIDFIKLLIKEELYSIITEEFYEITTTKDILQINVSFLQKIIWQTQPFIHQLL